MSWFQLNPVVLHSEPDKAKNSAILVSLSKSTVVQYGFQLVIQADPEKLPVQSWAVFAWWRWGAPVRAEMGTGDHVGMIRVSLDRNGNFRLVPIPHQVGVVGLFLPLPSLPLQVLCSRKPVEYMLSSDSIEIWLPKKRGTAVSAAQLDLFD